MNLALKTFRYGQKSIGYRLLYVDRKTLEIAVNPDSSIVIKVPLDADIPLVEKKLKKRARWIIKQINYFQQLNPKTPERRYLSGETHLYLGRQYRLKCIHCNLNTVKLAKGYFWVSCKSKSTPDEVKILMNEWYLQKARVQFQESFKRCWPAFSFLGISQPILSIKHMKKRWGSLTKNGVVTLNLELIRAPKECIDYVVSHELCHLKYNNHGSEFFKLLENVCPSWKKIKHKLELSMV
jgi:predicted metal-dependent hydrolase